MDFEIQKYTRWENIPVHIIQFILDKPKYNKSHIIKINFVVNWLNSFNSDNQLVTIGSSYIKIQSWPSKF